jgi:hypothetical protein
MPPLASLIVVSLVPAILIIFRLSLMRHRHETRELPFIADITHGICPRCGESHPRADGFKVEPASFWRNFSCRCGFAVKAHFRDAA